MERHKAIGEASGFVLGIDCSIKLAYGLPDAAADAVSATQLMCTCSPMNLRRYGQIPYPGGGCSNIDLQNLSRKAGQGEQATASLTSLFFPDAPTARSIISASFSAVSRVTGLTRPMMRSSRGRLAGSRLCTCGEDKVQGGGQGSQGMGLDSDVGVCTVA